MYNEDQKQRYIKVSDFTSDEVIKSFNNALTIEEFYQKDLCQFNITEVKKLLNHTDNKFNKIYYDYCNWCLSEALILYTNPYEIFIKDNEEEE